MYNINLVCLTLTREKLNDNWVRLWYNCTGSKVMLYAGTYEKVLTIQLYTIHWDFWEGITNCILCIGIFEKVQYISILYMGTFEKIQYNCILYIGTFEKIITTKLYTLHGDFWEGTNSIILHMGTFEKVQYKSILYIGTFEKVLARYLQFEDEDDIDSILVNLNANDNDLTYFGIFVFS